MSTSQQTISIQLLDGFSCVRDGTSFGLPHSTARVIALLALADGPVPRELAWSRLWPDQSADMGSGSLRTAVWRLERTCPDLVVRKYGRLGLRPDVEIDFRTLLGAAQRIRQSSDSDVVQEDAAQCAHHHELLPGWYDDWVVLQRERLHEITLTVLRRTAQLMYCAGHLIKALDLAMQALALEPLDEDTHMLVARIHLRQGNAAEAKRQYDLYSAVLRSELDLQPSKEFRSMLPEVLQPPARIVADPHQAARVGALIGAGRSVAGRPDPPPGDDPRARHTHDAGWSQDR